MPNYSRVAFAKQNMAKRIDQLTANGHYMMVTQVCHEEIPTKDVPSTSQHLQKLYASPPQIYSPTSANLSPNEPPKVAQMPSYAKTPAPMQQAGAIGDASFHNITKTSRLTPIQKFEQILAEDLETKTKAEVQRLARWYHWW